MGVLVAGSSRRQFEETGIYIYNRTAWWLNDTCLVASKLNHCELTWTVNVDQVTEYLTHQSYAVLQAAKLQRWPLETLQHVGDTWGQTEAVSDVLAPICRCFSVYAELRTPTPRIWSIPECRSDIGYWLYACAFSLLSLDVSLQESSKAMAFLDTALVWLLKVSLESLLLQSTSQSQQPPMSYHGLELGHWLFGWISQQVSKYNVLKQNY